EEGGNIAWTGNPYNAQLNLRTYKNVTANIAALSADQFSGGTNAHEDIRCYLILTETLLKPAISFDVAAPNTNSAGKELIERVRQDEDELNRQFFSLMLANTFQPLGGGEGNAGRGGAAVDLLENQINGLLSKVSSDYKLNFNIDNDAITDDNTVELGLRKGFLDDRLILSDSFGVETEADDHSSIIGDVNLEYRLKESGTFRVNVFNESNDKTIISDQQRGHFTQGAGLHYQEDFNGKDDFKALQAFLDIFRKKENKRNKNKRKKRQVPVPPKEGELTPESEN
ncbi:MAG: translocation/assembly module TamB domain-containing protein, partial [Crocinitomicaceae bacterium]